MARSELTLGFVGSGKVEKKNVFALLSDLIDASGGNARFILPMTRDYWNEHLTTVADYAIDNSIPVEAVVDDTSSKVRELKHLLGACRKQYQSAAPAHKMAALLEEARDGRLIVLWDDEDEDMIDAVRVADGKGIVLLELTRGLDKIELVAGDEDEDDPTSDEVPEDEPEDEPAVAQDDDDEPDDDEPEEEPEFQEAEAEDDLDVAADDDEEPLDLPDDDEEVVLVEDSMSEFQSRLAEAFENFSNAIVEAVRLATVESAQKVAAKATSVAEKVESKATARKAVAPPEKKATSAPQKAAGTSKRSAPARKAPEPEEEPQKTVSRTVKKPAAAKENGAMTKEQAQKIMDEYRPRRGRPPAEVVEARKVLGLI